MSLLRDLAGILADQRRCSRRDLVVSGLAMLAVGVALGLLAQWLLRGGLSEGWDALFERELRGGRYRRTPRSEILLWLSVGGALSAMLALVFLVFGLFSLKLTLRPRVKGD
jgi:hypothetical protein